MNMKSSATHSIALRLSPLDVSFFRDGRPFEAATTEVVVYRGRKHSMEPC